MMRGALVAGNWKMNGALATIEPLLRGVLNELEGSTMTCVVCPPFVYLAAAARIIEGSSIRLGGQNVSDRGVGALTGEIGASMLKDVGCEYVIVGHSERRTLFGETNDIIARKFNRAREAGLTPILCLGETLEERESERTEQVVEAQLRAVLDLEGVDAFRQAILAYEPIWAIGTGRTATPEQANRVHGFIRSSIRARSDEIAEEALILYGGSVKAANARGLFSMPDIDGGLIGGASLDPKEFSAICRAAG